MRIGSVSLLECNFVHLTETNSIALCQVTVCRNSLYSLRQKEKKNKSRVKTRETRQTLERMNRSVRRMSLASGRTHTLLQHACSEAYPLSQTWWKTLHLSAWLHLKRHNGGKGAQKGRILCVDLYTQNSNISAALVCNGKHLNITNMYLCAPSAQLSGLQGQTLSQACL